MVLNLHPSPPDGVSIEASMSIDNLSTQIEVQVVVPNGENSNLDLSTIRFRQSGFANVRLHWEQVGFNRRFFIITMYSWDPNYGLVEYLKRQILSDS